MQNRNYTFLKYIKETYSMLIDESIYIYSRKDAAKRSAGHDP